MLRDGANGSFMCDLLYQRRNRKDVTGMLYLKEGFLRSGFNSATLPCGGIGVCVLRFVGEVWNSENKRRKVIRVRGVFPLERLPISLRVSSVVGLLPYGFWTSLVGLAFPVILKWLYLLTSWCRVLFEKLTGLQLVKNFPHFTEPALKSLRHLTLSWTSPIQSIYPNPTSWRSILILSTIYDLVSPVFSFPPISPARPYTPPLLTHTHTHLHTYLSINMEQTVFRNVVI